MRKSTAQILKDFPEFVISKTRRHYRITHPVTGEFFITSSTPSGCRYADNFRADLRRLRKGCFPRKHTYATVNSTEGAL